MAHFIRKVRNSFRRTPSFPVSSPTTSVDVASDSVILEEDQLAVFKPGKYYPVNIGDVYDTKYRVLSKLRFGTTSTV